MITPPTPTGVDVRWNVRIPLRDGATLAGTLYLPRVDPKPYCVLTMTPYVAQYYHPRALNFAAHGVPVMLVDTRGRGNSDGEFRPFLDDGTDGCDVVEWLAAQPYGAGGVGFWGGSYCGFVQWATACHRPQGLRSLAPVAAPFIGVDFPMRRNIPYSFLLQWRTLTAGRTSQGVWFEDRRYWSRLFREHYEAGRAFDSLASVHGCTDPVLAEWFAHPELDDYWERYRPSAGQLAAIDQPVLTITGSYDDDQPGALAWYRAHLAEAPGAASRHFLLIGPWDHGGTRTPARTVGGVELGPNALLDLDRLHLEWYEWTMGRGPRPARLGAPVTYYVIGADAWCEADSLDGVTAEHRPLALAADHNPDSIASPGRLGRAHSGRGRFRYDPRDTSTGALQAEIDPECFVDSRLVERRSGRQLVYESAPFERDVRVAGFFRLQAWISIDVPDTDFQASVYRVAPDGGATWLTGDRLRARYRLGDRRAELVTDTEPRRYDFDGFTFTAWHVPPGHRLRLVIDTVDSMHLQKNYNSGGRVGAETLADARVATVVLRHDADHPSTLYVPIARTQG